MWDCSVCTYRNKPGEFKCSICDVRKGTSTRRPRLTSQVAAIQQVPSTSYAPPSKRERSSRLSHTDESPQPESSASEPTKDDQEPKQQPDTKQEKEDNDVLQRPDANTDDKVHAVDKENNQSHSLDCTEVASGESKVKAPSPEKAKTDKISNKKPQADDVDSSATSVPVAAQSAVTPTKPHSQGKPVADNTVFQNSGNVMTLEVTVNNTTVVFKDFSPVRPSQKT